MIDAVLFDYSGVLTTGLHLPTEGVPYDPDAVLVEMIEGLSSDAPHPWHELERGEISLVKYLEIIEDRVPGSGVLFASDSPFNVMANLSLVEDRMALAASLKRRGLAVGVLTNNVAEWAPLWRPSLPEGLFDVVIDSAEVGCRKPEPEIYRLALRALCVDDPSRALFIDDFEWNVAGALDCGLLGLHCGPETDLVTAVEAIIIGPS